MQAEDKEREEKWKVVMEEVHKRAHCHVPDHDSAEDLAGTVLEHLVRIDRRKPLWNILDNERLRKRIETRKMLDWFRRRATYLSRHQPLIMRNRESGEEYETNLGAAVDVTFEDEQYQAIETRDEAEVADREIRKNIGKRGAQVLDAVKDKNTLDPTELAEALDTRSETINSQIYAVRQKGKLLKI